MAPASVLAVGLLGLKKMQEHHNYLEKRGIYAYVLTILGLVLMHAILHA